MESVENVYNTIAKNFDKKRYKVWDKVAEFLDTLEPNTSMLEIGCGNGKNMLYRKDLECYGIDISDEQINICKKKQLNVVKSNMTSLPFETQYFDNIICIASYHHLDNILDRKLSLEEMFRVLKNNGRILITVWAREQEIDSKRQFNSSDEIVPWISKDGNTYYRYYHIYQKDELEYEINLLCPMFTVEEISYDKGNWNIILTK
jgi:ubiquinone/menaquinone biosynthesis C-methylase UbiE